MKESLVGLMTLTKPRKKINVKCATRGCKEIVESSAGGSTLKLVKCFNCHQKRKRLVALEFKRNKNICQENNTKKIIASLWKDIDEAKCPEKKLVS